MKHLLVALLFVASLGASALAQTAPAVVTPDNAKWTNGTGPMAGTQVAVLYGDPSKAGPFVLLVKAKAGSKFAPHTHDAAENVTLLQGSMLLGYGSKADESKMTTITPGSFVSIPAGVHHYAMAKEDSVFEISSTGPRTMTVDKP